MQGILKDSTTEISNVKNVKVTSGKLLSGTNVHTIFLSDSFIL